MKSSEVRTAGQQPESLARPHALQGQAAIARDVPADIAAANAAYVARLMLPPLTAAQANRIREIAWAANESAEVAITPAA